MYSFTSKLQARKLATIYLVKMYTIFNCTCKIEAKPLIYFRDPLKNRKVLDKITSVSGWMSSTIADWRTRETFFFTESIDHIIILL